MGAWWGVQGLIIIRLQPVTSRVAFDNGLRAILLMMMMVMVGPTLSQRFTLTFLSTSGVLPKEPGDRCGFLMGLKVSCQDVSLLLLSWMVT